MCVVTFDGMSLRKLRTAKKKFFVVMQLLEISWKWSVFELAEYLGVWFCRVETLPYEISFLNGS